MTLSIGQQAEQLALQYLQQQGLKLCQRNFRGRFGEIDLVMRDANTLVFIEVRLRKITAFGGAEGSITASKQKRYNSLPVNIYNVMANSHVASTPS